METVNTAHPVKDFFNDAGFIKKLSTGSFSNSRIAANTLGTIALGSIQSENADRQLGTSSDRITSVTGSTNRGAINYGNAQAMSLPQSPSAPPSLLEVLLSKDCGLTYTSLYKKWGASLVTAKTETTDPFVPKSDEWRRDSINLTSYINAGNIMLAFKNTTEFENNIYLDDINIRTITINPNLKAAGYLITPNPANNFIAVQFYPNPTNLKGIEIYNTLGQMLDIHAKACFLWSKIATGCVLTSVVVLGLIPRPPTCSFPHFEGGNKCSSVVRVYAPKHNASKTV